MDRPVVLKWAVGYCIFACIKLPYHILHSRLHFQVNILPYLNFHLPYDLKRGSFLSYRWLEAYKGALSYRCSHYFVCFLSHCTMQIAGFDGIPSKRKPNAYLGQIITKPWIIELPRSLVDVVVYWNLSMHYWLKTCKLYE